jgi:cell division protein FtsB
MSASRLVRAAQGQVLNLLDQIRELSLHIDSLQSENDRLVAENAAQLAQITDLLGVREG